MLNPHFEKLCSKAYIFPIIEEKLEKIRASDPSRKIYNLGVGDTAYPIVKPICDALVLASKEMTERPIGYGPCGGYAFLKEAICDAEYAPFDICPNEIFISDGANSDLTGLLDLFAPSAKVALFDPNYPVYEKAAHISGKSILIYPLEEENSFCPLPPKERADVVYLCTPSNPTGVAMNKKQLSAWISWAKKHGAILIIDNVYHRFATSKDIPPSIYALEGAKEVAIEVRSFSKWAGFTGLRCGYTVVPKQLQNSSQIHDLWVKRCDIKTNGVSYPIQRAAQSAFSCEAKIAIEQQMANYKKSSQILQQALLDQDQIFYGGDDAPYIFWKCPPSTSSWEFFDYLLNQHNLLTIPGVGFSRSELGFVRLSCFLTLETAKEAARALCCHTTTT